MLRLALIALLIALVGPSPESPLDLSLRYSTGLEFRPRNFAMRENERSLVRSLTRSLAQRGRPYDLVLIASGDLAPKRIENVRDYLRELGVTRRIDTYDLSQGDSPLRLLFDADDMVRRAMFVTLAQRDRRLHDIAQVLLRRDLPEGVVVMLDPAQSTTAPVTH